MKAPNVRLFPALAVATASLLALKLGDLWISPAPVGALDQAISRQLARADRAPLFDPDTTGSTAAPAKPPEPSPQAADVKAVNTKDKPAGSPAERGLLERLGERREELEKRQRDLDMRENMLNATDKKIDQKLKEVRDLDARAAASGGRTDGPEAGLKNLVVMYEAMKPKEAARVFEKLDSSVLVPVASAINARKMAEVLAAMNPDAAGKLTGLLAAKTLKPGLEPPVSNPALPPGELPAIEPMRR